MNLLMIIIILFAIMVSVFISYIAWKVSSDKPSKRKVNESGEAKEPKDLPDS
jgi:predicted membrane protein